MLHRSKHSQPHDLLQSKKIKTNHEGEEDTLFRPSHSVSELWQKMHFYLLKETFGYLDLRISTKLNR